MQEIYTLSFSAIRGRTRRGSREVRFSSKLGLSLGCIHLTLGLLCVVLGVVGLIAEFEASKLGSALWCGPIFQAAGAAGIVASRKWYRKSYVRTFCIASLFSAFVALLLFALTCVGIANHYTHFGNSAIYRRTKIGDYVANVSANLIVLSIVEAILSVISATVSAKAIKWRHVPPSDRPKRAMLVRETFMVAGGGDGSGSTFGPVTRITVPDVIRCAPDTLAAVHQMTSNREGHIRLRPRSETQILDPNDLVDDSWDSDDSDANGYDLNENDVVSGDVIDFRGNRLQVLPIQAV